MNSEKVKEIKSRLQEVLEYCAREMEKDLFQKSLTLINELESENERLMKDCADIANDYQEMGKFYYEEVEKNQKLKDRIAELGRENETKTDTITDLLKKQEFYEKEKLKQFAESIKMEFYHEFDEIISSIMSDKIDNILKEILGK